MKSCPTCEKPLAANADPCPHCGQKFSRAGGTFASIVLVAVFLAAVWFFLSALAHGADPTPAPSINYQPSTLNSAALITAQGIDWPARVLALEKENATLRATGASLLAASQNYREKAAIADKASAGVIAAQQELIGTLREKIALIERRRGGGN